MSESIDSSISELCDEIDRIGFTFADMQKTKDDLHLREEDRRTKLQNLGLSYEELLHRAASDSICAEDLEEAYECALELLEVHELLEEKLRLLGVDRCHRHIQSIENMSKIAKQLASYSVEFGKATEKELRARSGGLARGLKYLKPKDQLRKIWASGKFDSRDRCAEEEGRALGLSFSTARKILRGTPDPT